MIDLTVLLHALITLIAGAITAFLIPWLKAKIGAEKLNEVTKWVGIAVNAAEMIYTESGMGEEKKHYVVNFLESKGYTYDEDTINNLIEAAVLALPKTDK